MTSILVLGFLVGIRHAFEPDHLAAVASLVSHKTSTRHALRQGAAWGLGHTLTLFIVCSVVMLLETQISASVARVLEGTVGVLLIALAVDVIRRLVRERIHFHSHVHSDGDVHFHAHSHKGEVIQPRHPRLHDHNHERGLGGWRAFPFRFLVVGLMHGMAGSAALIVLTAQKAPSPWVGLAYVALFGVGSMVGMAMFSAIISVPLRGARLMTWAHNGLQLAIACLTAGIGATTVITCFGA